MATDNGANGTNGYTGIATADDVTVDGVPDFAIRLNGTVALVAANFVL